MKNLPVVLVFMGVAGSGKTTIAKLFSKKTGAIFYEGDDFHPAENVEKMSAGIPLTDADRKIWLKKLRKIIVRALEQNEFSALTCSALKQKYRDELSGGAARMQFVYLAGTQKLFEQRLKNRRGHFMPVKLLDSQFAILEPPKNAIVLDCAQSPKKIVAELISTLGIGN